MAKQIIKIKESDIRQMVTESIKRLYTINKKQNKISSIVNENIEKVIKSKINEANDIDNKRNAVMKSLKDNIYLHSELAYNLYHPKDQSERDTARSLFSKKVNGKPDADGNIRSFDDDEVNKLYNMIRQRK